MLKTVSSTTNAIGALNYKGTWNASTNTPTLASGVGTKGDYYVVSVAGSTALDGISNWGVGDLVTYNGTAWQRVEGGADLNGVNLSVTGTSTLSGLTASTALALNASKEVISVTNTGTGNNVLATAPTLVGDVTLSTGNVVIGTSGKGVDFSATPGTGTSELFDDYEEGAWTPVPKFGGNNVSMTYTSSGQYIKAGDTVTVWANVNITSNGSSTGTFTLEGLPFTAISGLGAAGVIFGDGFTFTGAQLAIAVFSGAAVITGINQTGGAGLAGGYAFLTEANIGSGGKFLTATYRAA